MTWLSSTHYIEKCKHGVIVRQCRCMSPDKSVRIVSCPTTCDVEEPMGDGGAFALTQRDQWRARAEKYRDEAHLLTTERDEAVARLDQAERLLSAWQQKADELGEAKHLRAQRDTAVGFLRRLLNNGSEALRHRANEFLLRLEEDSS